MFSDQRSKRVIFLAHCILNQNAISDGTADYPAAHREVVQAILDAQVGIVQMPCPELCCLGLDRSDPLGAERPIVVENTRIRREMERSEARLWMEELVRQVTGQVLEYRRNGFDVVGIVGMDRSPCCGVNTTSDENRELTGQGVFIAAVQAAMAGLGIRIPFIGIKTENAVERIEKLLDAECADQE